MNLEADVVIDRQVLAVVFVVQTWSDCALS